MISLVCQVLSLLALIAFTLSFIAGMLAAYDGDYGKGTFYLVLACLNAVWMSSAEKRKGKP